MDVTIRWVYMPIYHEGVQRKWLWPHDHNHKSCDSIFICFKLNKKEHILFVSVSRNNFLLSIVCESHLQGWMSSFLEKEKK